MRLALLGSDDALKTFLRDLPAEHQIVAAYEARPAQLPLAALLPAVERSEQWESLLVRDDVDLVIVADPRRLPPTADGMDPQVRRVDQLKKLAQAGKSLLVSHPAVDVLDAYEMEMLRREGGGVILPWFSALYHDAWRALPAEVGLGNVPEPLAWERTVTGRDKSAVTTALARDFMLMEQVVGKLKRVTALGGPAGGEASADSRSWHTLTVQVESARGHVLRWSVAAPTLGSACRVSSTALSGPAPVAWELLVPAAADQAVELRNSTGDPISAWPKWQDAAETLLRCEALQSRSSEQADEYWLAACRSLEAVAAVEKSLQRGRTIELSQAEQTEEHAFKGVMASAGCLLLLLMLAAVFVVSLVEGLQLPLRKSPIWRAWPLALVVPLAIFLGLQFLQTIIQKPRPDEQAPSS